MPSTLETFLLAGALSFVLAVTGWLAFKTLWDIRHHREHGQNEAVRMTLSGCEAAELIARDPDLVILDVRSGKAYAGGHIPGATLLDGDQTGHLSNLDRAAPYLIYCAGGYRSRKVFGEMVKLGFKRLYNLDRGFLGWRLAGREIEKSR
ncbi:MAG: rhodanese-like domain-containing protein [Verrucomicrobia bacterium]|nr:rhodanese-like domain-containing protein [Verrucomicrobiota bacterium]